MMALADWVEIIDQHDAKYGTEPRCVLELQPSEVDRLRHDLVAAHKAIEESVTLMRRYEDVLDRTKALAERYKDEAAKALDLARRFAKLELEPEGDLCPAPSQPVNVSWVYRAQAAE